MCTVQVLLFADVMRPFPNQQAPVVDAIRPFAPQGVRRRLFADELESHIDSRPFLAAALADLSRKEREKWNFDFVAEKPLPGRYQWVPVYPNEPKVPSTEGTEITTRQPAAMSEIQPVTSRNELSTNEPPITSENELSVNEPPVTSQREQSEDEMSTISDDDELVVDEVTTSRNENCTPTTETSPRDNAVTSQKEMPTMWLKFKSRKSTPVRPKPQSTSSRKRKSSIPNEISPKQSKITDYLQQRKSTQASCSTSAKLKLARLDSGRRSSFDESAGVVD